MYEHYYGFTEQPFSLTPDPRFFFRSASHQRALDELVHAIARGEGFLLLTGDIGTGKTTLCRTLLDQLGRLTFSALVLNPFVTEAELLGAILVDFGVVGKEEVRRGALVGATTQQLVQVLNQFLLSLAGIGATAVVVIDEAQNLPSGTLEQVRVLTNLETDRRKLLQILLVGQLNLVTLLKAPEMRQLDQRISRRCTLQALTRSEVDAYIAHRLRLAGGPGPVVFTPRAVDAIHRYSAGVPRLVNVLCNRVLEAGERKATSTITPAMVRDAAAALALEPPRRRASDRRRAQLARGAARLAAALATAGALGLAAWQVGRHYGLPLPGAAPRLAAGLPVPAPLRPPLPAATPAGPLPAPASAAGSPDAASGPAAASAASAAATPAVTIVSILVGSFATRAEAADAAARLAASGYPIHQIVDADGRSGYRVLIGPYEDLARAREDAGRIARDTTLCEVTLVTQPAPRR